jgi:hypothetical protein
MFDPIFFEMNQVFADCICSSLVPIGTLVNSLLCRQQLDESAAEMVEGVRLAKMPVQTLGKKLGQDVSPVQTTVDTVADRDVDQSVLGCQRNGWFCADFR